MPNVSDDPKWIKIGKPIFKAKKKVHSKSLQHTITMNGYNRPISKIGHVSNNVTIYCIMKRSKNHKYRGVALNSVAYYHRTVRDTVTLFKSKWLMTATYTKCIILFPLRMHVREQQH